MGSFYEKVIKEFPSLVKWKSWKKDSSYRIRVIEKMNNNEIPQTFIDIREYIVKDQFSCFTESGVCLNKENLDLLIKTLLKAQGRYFK